MALQGGFALVESKYVDLGLDILTDVRGKCMMSRFALTHALHGRQASVSSAMLNGSRRLRVLYAGPTQQAAKRMLFIRGAIPMEISVEQRVTGGLVGVAVGDALGVPVEFCRRDRLRANPLSEMIGYGTHNQPPGTWSDDTSLTLCAAESLLLGFNIEDMGKRFVQWYSESYWSARGEVFDVGIATRAALERIARGGCAEVSGERGWGSAGNGSLMRILPVALRFWSADVDALLEALHRASAITHAHPRCMVACGIYGLIVRELMAGRSPLEACQAATKVAREYYGNGDMPDELVHFDRLLSGSLYSLSEDEVRSDGYVVHTLEAAVWSFVRTSSFRSTVLTAVNLGEDTDTVGAVAGGLAGVCYGIKAIPREWTSGLARREDMFDLARKFAEAVIGFALIPSN